MKEHLLSKYSVYLILAAICISCTDSTLFEKVESNSSGIDFKNDITESDDFNIIDYLYFYNGGGVAIGDINGDDLPDIYFSGNQVKNKLYLNKGNLKFEDITERAGVAGKSTWNTGVVMGDVNGDGLLDIYVCAVVGLKGLNGYNELFINNGDLTFTEQASEFGLDFDSYSSNAAFLDYDLDGDLDMYILNHAIHTQESFGHADLRKKRSYATGDKLMRNDGAKFTDVSEVAQIFGGINGYGLGISIADFNGDGFPDIYVGNDFHEDDYYYLNNGNGTFSENSKKSFTHTSRFSMGNDVSDINHDGYSDIITLDMLSEEESVLKRSEGDESISVLKLRTGSYGYHYQFARNMLQINQGNGHFVETGLMSGVAATDWSWSALFADFDQDGNQDLFISNGIPRRPNDLDYIKFVSSEQIVGTINTTKLVDQKALELMPSGKIKNCIFRGTGVYCFENLSEQWIPNELNYSTATALGDLDNDGDVDIVINNVNAQPSIYVNQINQKANYLKVRFKYTKENVFGIGTKVFAYQKGILQYKELYTVRGFQSSSEPVLHFGFGSETQIDSLKIVWPNGKTQKMMQVSTNQTLVISPNDIEARISNTIGNINNLVFELINNDDLGLNFIHKEDPYTDFDRLKLMPYQHSDRGPATAVGDIDNDGLLDIYFGGSKHISGQFYIQSNTGFSRVRIPLIEKDSIKEDVVAVMADFDQNGKTDLFIGTGGADFYNKSKPLLDSYYFSIGTNFHYDEIVQIYENASCVKVMDFDSDGDLDLFVGNQSVPNDFGSIPQSYLLKNDLGKFSMIQQDLFGNMGMVTDATWCDYDQDGQVDLIVVGEWMSPKFFKNNNGIFEAKEVLTESISGLWQSIMPFDIDGDGDLDMVLGNWGLNSKFKASREYPMKMYYNDFDGNGNGETVIAIEKMQKYYTLDGLDMLTGRMVSLRKKYTNYKDFAGQTIEEVFSKDLLSGAKQYEVNTLASGYLENNNGKYDFHSFSQDLQVSPIMAMTTYDFDADGKDEVLLGGNYFGVQPFHGRFASFAGAMIDDNGQIKLGREIGLDLINQSVRDFNVIQFKKNKYLLVTINNDRLQIYKLLK